MPLLFAVMALIGKIADKIDSFFGQLPIQFLFLKSFIGHTFQTGEHYFDYSMLI
jgi:hypothetical protein